MIAHWVLYCLAVAALLAVAGAALERVVRLRGWSARWVWAVVLVGSLGLPAAVWLRPAPAIPSASVPAAASTAFSTGAATAEWAVLPVTWTAPPESRFRAVLIRVDGALGPLWLASSAGTLLLLLGSAAAVRHRRRRWMATRLDGTAVRVSRDTGPAALGIGRGEIVVPEWATRLAPELRALMIAHEREHLRAGDPRLLLGALFAVALMPWNPALWWQLRRLRLAVETDCDARVLRAGADVCAYGALLLEVGRRSAGLPLMAAALSEPTSFLERRIRTMTTPKPKATVFRTVALAAAAALLLVAACESPRPDPLAPRLDSALPGDALAELSPQQRESQDRAAVAAYFPAVLRDGPGGNRTMVFVTDDAGEIIATGTGADFGEAIGAVRGVGAPADAPVGIKHWQPKLDPEAGRTVSFATEGYGAGAMGPEPVQVTWIRPKTLHEDVPAGDIEMVAVGRKDPAGEMPTMVLAAPHDESGKALRMELLNAREMVEGLRANYPLALREAGVTGKAVLELRVGPSGAVESVRALEASHPQFGDAAVRTFRGALLGRAAGARAPITITQPVTFDILKRERAGSGSTIQIRGSAKQATLPGGSVTVEVRTDTIAVLTPVQRSVSSDTLKQTPIAQIRAAIQKHYPNGVPGDAAADPVLFIVDSQGRVLKTEIGAVGSGNRARTVEVAGEGETRRVTVRGRVDAADPAAEGMRDGAAVGRATWDLDPEAIESVHVLKGAVAAPFSAGGVIWITLKPGARLPD